MSKNQQPNAGGRPAKTIVSYVRRSPRMNPTQAAALERGRKQYGIQVPKDELETSIAPDAKVDFASAFGVSEADFAKADFIVEIGCGVGDSLAVMAANRPDAHLLAFEVFQRGVARTFLALEKHQLTNVRLIEADGVSGLETLISPGSLAEVWTFFPDPWQKKRHHKRRLINDYFASLVASRLRPGGLWRIATDWADYAEQIGEVTSRIANLELISNDRADRPITRFEQRGIDAGREITDFVLRRKDADASPA